MQRAAAGVPALRLGTAAYPVTGQCRVIDPEEVGPRNTVAGRPLHPHDAAWGLHRPPCVRAFSQRCGLSGRVTGERAGG